MTTVMSPSSSSPVTSPASAASPTSNLTHPALPPIITSPPASSPAPTRRTNLARPMSHASKSRLSQYSTGSVPGRSRPPSQMFAIYPSSLPYTTVRDFAYAPNHPLHYGPPPEPSRPPSGLTTPSSGRRLSDPPGPWDSKISWETGSWETASFGRATDIAPIEFRDGPPWSEDEDLQSPVVSSRHRKHKSTSAAYTGNHRKMPREERSQSQGSSTLLNAENYDKDRGYYAGTGGDGSERYYVSQGDEANGPGGEYVTYPPDQARHSQNSYQMAEQQPRQYAENDADYRSDTSSGTSSPGFQNYDESRYSRDYQFTITSPDEEMHGKAVALYDFQRENENELPLVEGQIIWVSYRHGQGWLVAEDPKTQESGLVPEEYVRLLRDIQGGMSGLAGQLEAAGSPNDAGTPTQAEHSSTNYGNAPVASNASNGYHQPVVSTFSTSSKDLEPYPQHMLGTQAGHPPPQVVHYHGQRGGSQANTPTLQSHHDAGFMRRGSHDTASGKNRDSSSKTQCLETLPGVKMEISEAASKKEGPETERNVEMTDR